MLGWCQRFIRKYGWRDFGLFLFANAVGSVLLGGFVFMEVVDYIEIAADFDSRLLVAGGILCVFLGSVWLASYGMGDP
jgi:hypothetical protein